MSNSECGTGRTQRRIVQALCAMLMGKTVLHVSRTYADSKDAMNYAKSWLHSNGWVSQSYAQLSMDNPSLSIRFGQGGLQFTCLNNAQGFTHSTVMQDHFVEEHIAAEKEAARIREEREADKDTIAKLMVKHGWRLVEGYGLLITADAASRHKVRLNLKTRTAE